MNQMIYGRGVVKSYGRTQALRGVTVDVAEAEIVAVTGPSGCGKSTLLLERLGIAHLADARPGEMSGGEQQRVALARALVTEPRVLFADEPTGALDSLAGEQVLGHLVRVAREQRTTVVLITHDARVAGYADREIVLRDGMLDPSGLGLAGAGLVG